MAALMMLPRGSVDGSRNTKHLKNAMKYVFLFDMVSELMGCMGRAWRQQVGQPQGFIAVDIT